MSTAFADIFSKWGAILFRTIRQESKRPFTGCFLLFVILTAASWYLHPLFSLVSFVPYMAVVFREKKNTRYYIQLYSMNVAWNLTVCYWLCLIRPVKGAGAIFINAALFLIPVVLWQLLVKHGRLKAGKPLVLLILWILFEYFHHIWDFSWTWLTVGNVFGQQPELVTWYTFMGVLGGSAWILLCNYLALQAILRPRHNRRLTTTAAAVVFPLLLSAGIFVIRNSTSPVPQQHFVMVGTTDRGTDSLTDVIRLRMADTMLLRRTGSDAAITIFPESMLYDDVWLHRLPQSETYAKLKRGLQRWRTKRIIMGTLLNVLDSAGLRQQEILGTDTRFNQYNAALMINPDDIVNIKLKKAYVPVEEYIPSWLSFLPVKPYGFTKEMSNADIFEADGHQYFVGICYEAVNTVFVAERINSRVNAIIMLASEAFFGPSTVGRRQYMNICRLRCVENNLDLLKASNDGITFAADHLGRITTEKRGSGSYYLQVDASLHMPSFYHIIVPFIVPVLVSLLAAILLLNYIPRKGFNNIDRKLPLFQYLSKRPARPPKDAAANHERTIKTTY